MITLTREAIREVCDARRLPEAIAATPHRQIDSTASLLADMHNAGEIDFPASFDPPSLAAVSTHRFFALQQLFCHSLLQIDCSAVAAANACHNMFERAGNDGAADFVYSSLSQWLAQRPDRAEEGLALIRRDPDTHRRLVWPVLISGANHDARKYSEQAFAFSDSPDSLVRSAALRALGHVAPIDDEPLITRAFDRFAEVIDTPTGDDDTAAAVEAALTLLRRSNGRLRHAIETVLEMACAHRTPATRFALADGLARHRRHYSEAMIDATFHALGHTTRHDIATPGAIDSMLYQCNLDKDRERVLGLLVDLLSHGEDALDIEHLSVFHDELRNQPGPVLGWYVASLLLTGDHAPCAAVAQLLPYRQAPEGFDIDLGAFSLLPPWIPYFARKVLGYCPLHKESAAALLMSCLRAVPEADRAELEDLVLDHFLLNYPNAIDYFETAVAGDDPAKDSVRRLTSRLRDHNAALERCGTCAAFRLGERERLLQGYRRTDFQREVHRKVEQGSLLSLLADTATILYGTASIFYVHRDAAGEPERQEVAMGAFAHSLEFPRLEAFDPVGFQYNIRRFRAEPPPS